MPIKNVHLLIVFIVCFVVVGSYGMYRYGIRKNKPLDTALRHAVLTGSITLFVIISLIYATIKLFEDPPDIIIKNPFGPAVRSVVKRLSDPVSLKFIEKEPILLDSSISTAD